MVFFMVVVADAGGFDSGGEVVPDLVGGAGTNDAAEEGGDILGLDGVDGGPNEGLVEGLEVLLALEDDVGGVLGLVDAPVDPGGEVAQHGAEAPSQPVEAAMELFDPDLVGQDLGPGKVGDVDEGVVDERCGR
jgi:hypothetical protein